MIVAALAAGVLVALTVLVHYETLRMTSELLPKLFIRPRQRIIVVIFACFLAHMIEIWLYAGGYYLLGEVLGLGGFTGAFGQDFLEYVYFSTVSYTSLGLGDVWPNGAHRLLTGIEALNGLVLIGWSVSFTYFNMEKFWDLHGPDNE